MENNSRNMTAPGQHNLYALAEMHDYIAQIRDDMLLFDSRTSEFSILLSIYIIIIILAAAGSLLVIIVIICSNHLRTTSNYYIVNLAISDLLLVLIACPATITHVSSSHWPLSPIPALHLLHLLDRS